MTHYRLWPALATHRGQRRRLNEDSIAYVYPDDPQVLQEYGALFLLADGVGGLSHGEQYSQQAVQTICDMYYQTPAHNVAERLARVLRAVNSQLHALEQGGASTIVAAVFHGDSLTVANAGDSPAYIITPHQIRKLTIDHVVDDPNNPKSKRLFRALGYESAMTVDTVTGRICPGMRLLLCSDGLTRYYTDEQLQSECQPYNASHTVESLVHGAYLRGGIDNISAIVVEVAEKTLDDSGLREHVAALNPAISLPEALSNVQPLFAPYMKPYSVPDPAGTIYDTVTRKSFLRTHALPPPPLPRPLTPEHKLTPTPSRRPSFWEWFARRPVKPAPLVPPAPLLTNLDEAAQHGLTDSEEDPV
jgi:PPM family protein phosphatase